MSARMVHVGATDRLTLPIPFGQHVYVVSDLSLSPATDPSSRPIKDVIQLLGDIDDAAVVVVAGNLFHPGPTADLTKHIRATFDVVPELVQAIRDFCAAPGHQCIVLPGARDAELASDETAQRLVLELGASLSSDIVLQVATANGVRDVAVAAGTCDVQTDLADRSERDDAELLEDPSALARFVASRILYRRLGVWVWLPVVALGLFDVLSAVVAIVGHFTHHHLHVHTPHTQSFWGNLLLNLLIIVVIETIVVACAGLMVRRRFDRGARRDPTQLSEPLSQTKVHGVDAIELARRVAQRGGAGAVVGGARRPALAVLDRGVSASPGPSRTVVIERRGRFGLPPVFTSNDRIGIVEVEAASAVHVRLYAGQTRHVREPLLEQLVATADVQPALPDAMATVGSWPTGDPFPVASDRLREQRRQRTVRRWASGLLFLDGLVNVIVTAAPPLRGRLDNVLSVLPLGVMQSAAALVAVAGIAMIMMARGIRRGQRRAWFAAVIVLSFTVVLHIARGGTFVASVVAVSILTLLIVERRYFQASTDRTSLATALPRLVLVAAAAVAAAVVGIEASLGRHHFANVAVLTMASIERLVGFTNIALPDGVSDFIDPALFAIGMSLIVITLYLLTRPVVDRRLSGSARGSERRLAELRAREIVRRHGRGTLDYFALRDDKQFFFFRDSLVAYAVYGGVALVSPDPIGPVAERTEAFSAYRAYAESRGWTIGVIGASEEWLTIYQGAGLHHLYIGDEAIVDCTTFNLAGGKMKGLRQACTRLARHGYTIEYLDPANIDPSRVTEIVELISMLRRGEGERGFSMMLGRLFDPKDKGLLLTLVHGPDGKPVAACQFLPSPAINGYSLDLMRRDPGEHPNGLLDYALCSTIAYLAEHGARGLSLNFAAFRSVIEGDQGDGAFTRVERWALKRLSGILPIESLWTFNSKYNPTWLPRYLVYPAAESFVPVAAAVLRAESLTELPVIGRFLTSDPSNRPGTVVPDEVLEAAKRVDKPTLV